MPPCPRGTYQPAVPAKHARISRNAACDRVAGLPPCQSNRCSRWVRRISSRCQIHALSPPIRQGRKLCHTDSNEERRYQRLVSLSASPLRRRYCDPCTRWCQNFSLLRATINRRDMLHTNKPVDLAQRLPPQTLAIPQHNPQPLQPLQPLSATHMHTHTHAHAHDRTPSFSPLPGPLHIIIVVVLPASLRLPSASCCRSPPG